MFAVECESTRAFQITSVMCCWYPLLAAEVFEGRMIVTIREIHTSPSRHVYIPPPPTANRNVPNKPWKRPNVIRMELFARPCQAQNPNILTACIVHISSKPPTHPSESYPACIVGVRRGNPD